MACSSLSRFIGTAQRFKYVSTYRANCHCEEPQGDTAISTRAKRRAGRARHLFPSNIQNPKPKISNPSPPTIPCLSMPVHARPCLSVSVCACPSPSTPVHYVHSRPFTGRVGNLLPTRSSCHARLDRASRFVLNFELLVIPCRALRYATCRICLVFSRRNSGKAPPGPCPPSFSIQHSKSKIQHLFVNPNQPKSCPPTNFSPSARPRGLKYRQPHPVSLPFTDSPQQKKLSLRGAPRRRGNLNRTSSHIALDWRSVGRAVPAIPLLHQPPHPTKTIQPRVVTRGLPYRRPLTGILQ